ERLQAAAPSVPPPEPSGPRRVAVPLHRPDAPDATGGPAPTVGPAAASGPAAAGVAVNASSVDPARFD
ncbi:MAG TPA: hypothetical protein VFX74_02345, partial [Candidatus Limnocylindria bacterium]|nr:hypothetical protein [Candidatus Limnocylindria bacterium]